MDDNRTERARRARLIAIDADNVRRRAELALFAERHAVSFAGRGLTERQKSARRAAATRAIRELREALDDVRKIWSDTAEDAAILGACEAIDLELRKERAWLARPDFHGFEEDRATLGRWTPELAAVLGVRDNVADLSALAKVGA